MVQTSDSIVTYRLEVVHIKLILQDLVLKGQHIRYKDIIFMLFRFMKNNTACASNAVGRIDRYHVGILGVWVRVLVL